jgi:hypothetical protein
MNRKFFGTPTLATVMTGGCSKQDFASMRLYFVRRAARDTIDLWTIAADGTDERRLFNLGAFRPIDIFFDVSKRGDVVWAPFLQGDRQVWGVMVR